MPKFAQQLTHYISEMPKTYLQIQSFLAENSYRSRTDWEMISAFCKDKTDFSINVEFNPEEGITASDFIQWYEHGFGAGDIVISDGKISILGKSDFKASTIVGIISDDKLYQTSIKKPVDGFKMPLNDDVVYCRALMLKNKLQFSWKTYSVVDKYIPAKNERVIFHGEGVRGLGVIRSIDVLSGEVDLYCYYIYETKACGYSMQEKGICNLHDYIFEPMDNGDKRQSKLNGISCQRRLNRELERFGKTWNQSRHRVEPIQMQVEHGKKYWYINDELKLVPTLENGLQTAKNRALAGNYFQDASQGTEVLGQVTEIIRNFLASPESNPKGRKKSK